MKSYPVLVALLVIACNASAQFITEEGLIVNQAGDTLRGQVRIPRSDKTPTSIEFIRDGKTTRYRPDEIPYFRFGNDASYIGVITDVDKTPKTVKQFDDPSFVGTSVKRDTVFLSIAVLGKMSLFKLVDNNNLYYVRFNDKLTPLTLRVQLVNLPNGNGIATYDVYKDQLKSVITNCPQAEPWIDKTDYTQASLSKLILKFNACQGETSSFIQKQPGAKLIISAFGGVVSSSLNNSGETPPAKVSYSGSTKAIAGLGFEIAAGKMQKRLSLLGEVLTYSVEFTNKNPTPTTGYFYDLSYVRINLGARIYLTGGEIKPYVQAGVGMGRAYKSTYFSGQPANQSFIPAKGESGLHFAAGVKYRRLGLQVRYERSGGFSESRAFVTKVTNLSGMLTFDLNKPKE
ncbi:MAG TPA: hypothetical protein VFE50_21300 [Cyclobacteriaceae bacterium]|nr:hypothetical protein [Cyclobacteriaceae bacterium]